MKLPPLLRQDWEDFPPKRPSIPKMTRVPSRVRNGPRRIDDLGELLLEGNQEMAQPYLEALFGLTIRQVGARLCLFETFTKTAKTLPAEVLDAMPSRTRDALHKLIAIARQEPVECGDEARLIAHALTVDGATVAWLLKDRERKSKTKAKRQDADAAFRRLSMRLHPDRGSSGDSEAMQDLLTLREAARKR